MNVLIGFDNAASSGYIFNDLKSAGLPPDTRFHIVSATDLGTLSSDVESATISGEEVEGWQSEISAEERAYLDRMLDNARKFALDKELELKNELQQAEQSLRAAFPGAQITSTVSPLGPFEAISGEAEHINADIIVVGSQNASTLSRLFLGSVSQKVVSYASRSVRIARAQAEPHEGAPRLIIGIDGSEDARKAVDAVARRTWPDGTSIKVIAVIEEKQLGRLFSSMPTFIWGANAAAIETEETPRYLATSLAETAAARLREAGLDAEAIGLHGDAKSELMNFAVGWQANAIFLGAHGNDVQKGHPLGAVANALATRSNCSLEIIRG